MSTQTARGQPRRTNSSPLTPIDALRLAAFLVFFVGHSFMMNLCQLAVSPWLGLLSPRVDRKYNQQVERWFGVLLLTATRIWAPTTLVLTGDRELLARDGSSSTATPNSDELLAWFAPAIEHGCMVISNHQTYFDWIIIWIMGYFVRCHGLFKITLKAELKHVPVFGWGMRMLDFIFLERKWAKDQLTFARHMRRIVEHDDPAWLLIFPEGTVVCEKRTAISNAYADKMGLKRPAHTLLPRTSGSRVCLSQLRPRIEYLYDLTIGYEGLKSGDIPEDEYGLVSMYGKRVYPREIHIHVKRHRVADIPDDEDGFSQWMLQVFAEKDERMAKFYELGRFPHTASEDSSIPEGRPVLQLTKPATSATLAAEMLWVWAQFAAILVPARYVYGALWTALATALAGLW
ncbi:hypothetical protein IWQ56_005682 [Coemansia nantahalensis]|uniref:Uncharacterized protein n=1 Tax=Coemansia nantahalensis TaxID=2789366 RepID=A0ACC1K6L7_9FUNG|nr:hypothetical protein IWQ56_005682 [Coemansia nantahalensis]KAJ2774493.1 hypothetical protein IWQ57_000797 [Coemansia nantahalensis]